jgi:hypothetical protein
MINDLFNKDLKVINTGIGFFKENIEKEEKISNK